MKNIAIIPARSGSKGLKDKNVKNLCGKPLLAYSIEAAQTAEIFDEIMVSTDSIAYAQVAKTYGASVPFLRSEEMSGDTAGSWGVVKEVLERYRDLGKLFDSVCLLQPTSPLRQAEDIINGYQLLFDRNADAITGVCEEDHPPLWSMVLPSDLSLKRFRKHIAKDMPRQALDTYYRINGALYIRRIQNGQQGIELLRDKEYALIMSRNRSVDIDTIEDFNYAAYLISGGYNLAENQFQTMSRLRRCA